MCREKNPAVINFKITNPLGTTAFSKLPIEPRPQAGQRCGGPGSPPTLVPVTSPNPITRVSLPSGNPSHEDSPQHAPREEDRLSTSEDVPKPYATPVVPAQTVLHHLQTPGSGRQNKTSQRLHSRTFRHSTAVKPSDRFDSRVCQQRRGAGVGARQPVRAGGGAAHGRTPARLRRPDCEEVRSYVRRKWAGLVVPTTRERSSTHTELRFGGPPRHGACAGCRMVSRASGGPR